MSKTVTATRMKVARTAAGLTQAAVAEKAGMYTQQYNAIEAKGSGSLETFTKIADALGVSLDYLSGRTDGDDELQRRTAILAQIEELKAQLA